MYDDGKLRPLSSHLADLAEGGNIASKLEA
jgi:hypothetical protein